MAAIAEESAELEAMRKDCSWHPCRVSLSSKNAIIVDFESCDEVDIISDREDALTRLRFRSTPLQDGECSHIKEGECVLAMHKTRSRGVFFDAVVEKPYRVKHSNRVHCRCTFEIKWLNPELKDQTITIPSRSIMKLSNKCIDNHPVFAAFLNAMDPTDGAEVPSFLSLFDETNCEADLHGILEKQIEEISRLANGSKEGSADLLKDERVNLNGRKQNKLLLTSYLNSKNSQDNCRRSTRSQNKQQLEVELNKEKVEDKPFLSPLAARAALASLVHELPQKPDFSIYYEEKEDHVDFLEKDPKKLIQLHSLDVTCKYMRSNATFKDSVSIVSDPTQNADSETPVESRDAPRLSVSKHRVPSKKSKRNESQYQEEPLQPNESQHQEEPLQISREPEAKKVSIPTSTRISRKSHDPATATRFTRSAMQKQILVSSDEVKHGSLSEKAAMPVNARRLTRSAMQKEGKNSDIKQELGKSELNEDTQDISEDLVTPDNKDKKRRLVSSPLDPDSEIAQETQKRMKRTSFSEVIKEDLGINPGDGESSAGKKKKAISSKKAELRSSPRLRFLPRTRSQTKASPAC